jgi:ATP-dependent Clp protease adaptor protein ClpS
MSENLPDLKEDVVTNIEEEVTEPPMFKVLLHNDDFTTKEFVVKILVSVFSKSLDEATQEWRRRLRCLPV